MKVILLEFYTFSAYEPLRLTHWAYRLISHFIFGFSPGISPFDQTAPHAPSIHRLEIISISCECTWFLLSIDLAISLVPVLCTVLWFSVCDPWLNFRLRCSSLPFPRILSQSRAFWRRDSFSLSSSDTCSHTVRRSMFLW